MSPTSKPPPPPPPGSTLPGQGAGAGTDRSPDPAAPLVSTWQVRASAGEPQATVRVRNLQSVVAAGRDAWGRAAKPQPLLLSAEVSFAHAFETASSADAVNAETAHYGNLSKRLLGGVERFSPAALSGSKAAGGVKTEKKGKGEKEGVPRTADVFQLLWVQLTGRVVDGSSVALPPDQVPFLDAARLRSLELTLHLPKASLLGDGVSLGVTAGFCDSTTAEEEGEEKKRNPQSMYARCLRLHGLHVPTLVGVNLNERAARQMLVVDVEIERFDLDDDVHVELEAAVVKILEASSFETLEALGMHIANKILDEFRVGDSPQPMRERGWQVKVCLEKPIAVPFADCPAVEVCVGP
ncbi:hypothetical protein F4777DRAFT_545468 [Nemania sp. FL0916]|nr:hypothetical protein F4777DRAFT_545468 [Nemania sp. FL0916]